MGKRGPPRKPLKVLEKHGSPRAKGRKSDGIIEINEVQGVPKMPKDMVIEAQRHWKSLMPRLSEMGVVTLADELAIKFLCEQLAEYDKLKQEIRESPMGHFVLTKSGLAETAQSKKLDLWRKEIRAMMSDYGLQASSRASLGSPLKADQADKSKARFFERE